MNNMEDFRIAAGFGMGTTKMDNDLISEAFIMGAGAAAGMAVSYLELDEEEAYKLAALIYSGVESVLGKNGE